MPELLTQPFILVGSNMADTLTGGGGNDFIQGGIGEDELTGGAGADRFVYTRLTDGNDMITDFNPEQGDVIDLVDLFNGESNDIEDYILVEFNGMNSELHIDALGQGIFDDMTITLVKKSYHQADLPGLWNTGGLNTGNIRPAFEITASTVNPVAKEITREPGIFNIYLHGSGGYTGFTIPFQVEGSAKRGIDYRLETDSYNPATDTYEIISLDGNFIPVDLKSGDTALSVRVLPVSDDIVEPSESVIVTLLPSGNLYQLGEDITVEHAIEDGLDVISITATRPTAFEAGLVKGMFTVSRTAPTPEDRIVQVKIQGTAVNGVDYEYMYAEVTIPRNRTEIFIDVIPISDLSMEDDEYIEMLIVPEEEYAVSNSISASVTVTDLPITKGDTNGNTELDLGDAITALKIVTGIPVPVVYSEADVNNDSRIGIEETVYILQVLSE
ncbi:MAG: type I secretion C-terminal target domain-containing protein [Desulfobacterales bacterium]|nr:type I secretion C-terminal target domain-containing protein [Desulfobacterales bacterium]